MPDSQHVFISYARNDGREYAARLDTDLKSSGFQTWRDTRDIDPNQDFKKQWESYTKKLDDMGKSLDKAHESYQELVHQRRKALDKPLSKIDSLLAQTNLDGTHMNGAAVPALAEME